MKKGLTRIAPSLTAAAVAAAFSLAAPAQAADNGKFRIGVVTFLSGGAAGPFGVPSLNGAKVMVEALNAAKVPAPYGLKGINGRHRGDRSR